MTAEFSNTFNWPNVRRKHIPKSRRSYRNKPTETSLRPVLKLGMAIN